MGGDSLEFISHSPAAFVFVVAEGDRSFVTVPVVLLQLLYHLGVYWPGNECCIRSLGQSLVIECTCRGLCSINYSYVDYVRIPHPGGGGGDTRVEILMGTGSWRRAAPGELVEVGGVFQRNEYRRVSFWAVPR